MASLSLKHIYKIYDGTTRAVSDFNMEIRDREFIVFVGPSGCGKSTTLRMIAGLEDISAGELRIDGVVVNDMEPRDRNIAMVFQNYALYPHMTVYENMAFSLKTAHVKKDEIHRKVTEAARILGITEYLERKPRALSGGQRQRVALGRAIVRNPKVFLFDEPLSNLDAKLRAAMRAEIIRLYERLGTTFIYVTHDQVEAMTMGSRIVVMRGGFVQQIDTPKNLYNHPENLFVAGFIGTPRMNFWNATLLRQGNSVTAALDAGVTFSLPYRTVDRVPTKYMDGTHPLIVGVRPDDVRPWSDETAAEGWARLSVTVSVVEALGGETLIYGRLGSMPSPAVPAAEDAGTENAAGDEGAASSEIILKASAEHEVKRGEFMEVAVNLRKLHIFDRESERALTVRIPQDHMCPCTVDDGAIFFAGQRFSLPPALTEKDHGTEKKPPVEGELILPVDAILLGTGAGRARVIEVEQTQESDTVTETLYRLDMGGDTFFARETGPHARFSPGDILPFDIDFSRLTVQEADILPLPAENRLRGRFVKEKILDESADSPTRGRRVYRFFLEIADEPIPADKELAEKLFSCKGSRIFDLPLLYAVPPDAIRIEDDARAGTTLSGRVEAVLDYGRNTFLRVLLGSQRVIVPMAPGTRAAVGGLVGLVLDQTRLSVIDREADMVIV